MAAMMIKIKLVGRGDVVIDKPVVKQGCNVK